MSNDKAELATAITASRAAWESTIDELGDEGLEAPNACDNWRVRDVLAHFYGWEHFQLAHLRAVVTGVVPSADELFGGIEYPPIDGPFSEDAQNASFFAANRDRSLADVVADWRNVSDLLASFVDSSTQEQLDASVGTDWAESDGRFLRLESDLPTVNDPHPVAEWIASHVRHRNEHLDVVRAWMSSRSV